MSGVLLSVAFYGILRLQAISDLALGPGLMRAMLLGGGLLSLTVAAALMIGQRDYKRLLAYSSTEHMGILAIGAGIGGPLAMAAVLLHILGHGLAKATLFVVAGRILADRGTAQIDQVSGLLAHRPSLAWPFLVGMGTLLGFPPGALFFTEVTILVAGWQQGLGWVSLAAAALLVVIFAVLAKHTLAMTLGADAGATSADRATDHRSWTADLPLAAALAATAVVGLSPAVGPVLESALAVLGGAR
jgi:hydrogenase-4 component F